jgi:hypothetical protein
MWRGRVELVIPPVRTPLPEFASPASNLCHIRPVPYIEYDPNTEDRNMHTRWKVGVVIGAMVFAGLAIGGVQTRAGKKLPDLTGTWTLDAARSELPGGRGEFRGRRGGEGRSGWGGEGRDGGRRWGGGEARGGLEGRGFRRGPALPGVMRITQGPNGLELADSAGVPFQEIRIGAESTVPEGAPGNLNGDVRRLTGRWDDGTLNVERTSPRGGVMVQKFRLADQGRTLEVRMERKRGESRDGDGAARRSARGFKLVYRRAA